MDALPPLAAEDHVCASCDFAYLSLNVAAAVAGIRSVPDAVRTRVTALSGPAPRRRRHPAGAGRLPSAGDRAVGARPPPAPGARGVVRPGVRRTRARRLRDL